MPILYFVRHAHSSWTPDEMRPLSAQGFEDASRVADFLEGYPIDAKKDLPAPFVYTGTAIAFQKAGFVEVARRSETRPIMRYFIEA